MKYTAVVLELLSLCLKVDNKIGNEHSAIFDSSL